MPTYIFSLGTKSGGSETVTISSGSGTSPGPYTRVLSAPVPATVRVGDKFVTGANTFLITGPDNGDRTISGSSLTLHKVGLAAAPFNSGSDPATSGSATISRAFAGWLASAEGATRQDLSGVGVLQFEYHEDVAETGKYFTFGCTGTDDTHKRVITSAPGKFTPTYGTALRVDAANGVIVTISSDSGSYSFEWDEPWSEVHDLQIVHNAGAIVIGAAGVSNGKIYRTIQRATGAYNNRCFVSLGSATANKFYQNVCYYDDNVAAGAESYFARILFSNQEMYENVFGVVAGHSGSPQLNAASIKIENSCTGLKVFNNAFLGTTADPASIGTGVTYAQAGNNLCLGSTDASMPGTNNLFIDGTTVGQRLIDVITSLTSGSVDLRPLSSQYISGVGQAGSATDITGGNFANPPSIGAEELYTPAAPTAKEVRRRRPLAAITNLRQYQGV